MINRVTPFLFGFLCVFPVYASQADPVIELNELMSKLATLEADFDLEIRDQKTNEMLDQNNGTLIVKRPGYFYVHTKEPFEQFIISDRKVIWTYDVELEQATSEPVDERLQQTPFLLLSGDVDAIRENFSVAEPEIHEGVKHFALSPRDANASYDNVILNFDASDVLTGMTWHNSLGEDNAIVFSAIKTNEEIPDSTFSFQPPAGVDVEIKNADTPALP